MRNQDVRAAFEYHEATKHSEVSLRRQRHFLDWANQPIPFKLYREVPALPLPREFPEREVPALEAIATIGAAPGEAALDLRVLARLLLLAAGVTKRRRHPGGEVLFRAYANTGALHHVDVYLATGDLPDLAAGVYHFGPHDFSLRRLREGDLRDVLVDASGGNPAVARAPVI